MSLTHASLKKSFCKKNNLVRWRISFNTEKHQVHRRDCCVCGAVLEALTCDSSSTDTLYIQEVPPYLPFYDNRIITENGKEMNVDCGVREVLIQKCIPHNTLVP